MTETVWPEATARLRTDPAFGPLVEQVGPVELRPRRGTPFASLVAQIIYQQLAGAAASTIHRRFMQTLREAPSAQAGAAHPSDDHAVTPAAILALPEDEMRGAGLSRGKTRAIRDLARKVEDGALRLDALDDLPEREVIAQLTQVHGIGPWTAHMYLLFDLRRPDVWPTGDLGVRKGLGRVLGLATAPAPDETRWIGTGYRPWRSAVAWYCWQAVDALVPEG